MLPALSHSIVLIEYGRAIAILLRRGLSLAIQVGLLRLREGCDLPLVDARQARERAASYGHDLHEGMFADLDGQVAHAAHAAAAVAFLSRLSTRPDPFSSERVTPLAYPLMRRGRSICVRLLGRRRAVSPPVPGKQTGTLLR